MMNPRGARFYPKGHSCDEAVTFLHKDCLPLRAQVGDKAASQIHPNLELLVNLSPLSYGHLPKILNTEFRRDRAIFQEV